MLYLKSKIWSINVNPSVKNTVNEWLKRNDFKHVNGTQFDIIPAGYDYGDCQRIFYTFPLRQLINCRNPDINLISNFLKMGADPNFYTKTCSGSVLHTVLINNNFWNDETILLIELLIKYGANVNSRYKYDQWTPLHIVAYNNPFHARTRHIAEEIIELLIENNANILAKDNKGNTPYHNLLVSHNRFEHKNKPIPEKILYLLTARE